MKTFIHKEYDNIDQLLEKLKSGVTFDFITRRAEYGSVTVARIVHDEEYNPAYGGHSNRRLPEVHVEATFRGIRPEYRWDAHMGELGGIRCMGKTLFMRPEYWKVRAHFRGVIGHSEGQTLVRLVGTPDGVLLQKKAEHLYLVPWGDVPDNVKQLVKDVNYCSQMTDVAFEKLLLATQSM